MLVLTDSRHIRKILLYFEQKVIFSLQKMICEFSGPLDRVP